MVAERQLRAVPGVVASPIEQAIDRVAEQAMRPQLITLPILDPLKLESGNSVVVSIPPGGEVALLLVDQAEQGWHPVVLEPGSHWELREVGKRSDLAPTRPRPGEPERL